MIPLRVVTAYVPIPDHPRTAEEYGKLGENFRHVKAPVKAYYQQLEQCRMWRVAKEVDAVPHPGDNPKKNTVAYHSVQHQKFEWLMLDALLNPEPEIKTFVWMDYGIFHQPGVTAAVINDFLEELVEDDLAIPGCHSVGNFNIRPSEVCWRFCGSLAIVPRAQVSALSTAVKLTAMRNLYHTKRTTWEVNTWAQVERKFPVVPIRWYKADHDQTMFTNYQPPDNPHAD